MSTLFEIFSKYDGIVEKRKQGTGLQLTVAIPTPPKAYRMSYAIYLQRD